MALCTAVARYNRQLWRQCQAQCTQGKYQRHPSCRSGWYSRGAWGQSAYGSIQSNRTGIGIWYLGRSWAESAAWTYPLNGKRACCRINQWNESCSGCWYSFGAARIGSRWNYRVCGQWKQTEGTADYWSARWKHHALFHAAGYQTITCHCGQGCH